MALGLLAKRTSSLSWEKGAPKVLLPLNLRTKGAALVVAMSQGRGWMWEEGERRRGGVAVVEGGWTRRATPRQRLRPRLLDCVWSLGMGWAGWLSGRDEKGNKEEGLDVAG